MIITVVNKHHGAKGEYIGRGSPLGNPFKLKSAGGQYDREESIRLYQNYIIKECENGNMLIINELFRLHKLAKEKPLNLVCYCAPKTCHGDVIKDILEKVI